MKSKCIPALLCILLLLCSNLLTAAASDAAAVLSGLTAYKMEQSGASTTQEWIDGELTENAGITSEWYVLALSQSSGNCDFSGYSAALRQHLSENQITSATTRQKYALLLLAVGSEDGYIAEALGDSIGQQGLMSWVYGLHLLHNTGMPAAYTQEEIIAEILALQLPDGGWAITGNASDVDVTAMTLQALAPHYPQYSTEIDRALLRLSELQREDGGYASYGVPNPESAAQVMITLSCLGIDCLHDGRFIKNGKTLLDGILPYRLSSGGFCHAMGGTENQNATAQVFLALTAYEMQQNGEGSLYLLEKREETAADVPQKKPPELRLLLTILIAAVTAAVCVVVLVQKRSRAKRLLAVFVLAGGLIAAVWLIELKSADDYYTVSDVYNPCGSVILSIRCDTIAGMENAPESPQILAETQFPIADGDTVFDVLRRAVRTKDIHMEYSGSTQMAYIEGIGGVYEFDFGDLSGWVYHVNGESPSVGCGEYAVSDGDRIEWLYSLDLGNDVK